MPAKLSVRPGRAVRLYPLEAPPADALFLVSATSAEPEGIAVEARRGGAWMTLDEESGASPTLAIPVEAGEKLRLRLWSVDRRGGAAAISVAAASPAAVPESRLAGGAEPAAIAGFSPPTGVLRVSLERPGTFRIDAAEAIRWSPGRGRRAVAANSLIEATGTTLWLVRETGTGRAPARIAARRVRLAPGSDLEIEAGDPPAVVDLEGHEGPIAAVGTTTSGVPGLRIDDAEPGGASAPALAASGTAALAVSLGGKARAVSTWSAEDEALPLQVRLRTIGFAPTRPGTALSAGGTWNGALGAGTAAAFTLPPGRKNVRVALEKDLAAALSRNGRVEATAWSATEPSEEEFETESDTLQVFNLGAAEARASASVLAANSGEGPGTIAFDAPLESNATRREILHRSVEARAGDVLHVRGKGAQASYVSPAGRVRRGNAVPLDAGRGALSIAHEPGPLLCWIEHADGRSGAWGGIAAGTATEVKAPAVVALRGSAGFFRIASAGSGPRLLHLRSASPAVARIGAGRFEAFPDGIDIDLPAGGDATSIALRGFAGQPLAGTLEIESTPVTAAGEGLGAPVLVPPGGTRGFSFRTDAKEEIGIGVRASSEAIDAELVGPDGARLGTGIVQMPTLEPGTYVLVVRVPRASAPVLVRPAIAGLERPGTGPPADVIRRYLHPEGDTGATPAEASAAKAPASENHEGAAPEEPAAETGIEGIEAEDAGGMETEPPAGPGEEAASGAEENPEETEAPPPPADDEPPPPANDAPPPFGGRT
jgi:hypothetical protein